MIMRVLLVVSDELMDAALDHYGVTLGNRSFCHYNVVYCRDPEMSFCSGNNATILIEYSTLKIEYLKWRK